MSETGTVERPPLGFRGGAKFPDNMVEQFARTFPIGADFTSDRWREWLLSFGFEKPANRETAWYNEQMAAFNLAVIAYCYREPEMRCYQIVLLRNTQWHVTALDTVGLFADRLLERHARGQAKLTKQLLRNERTSLLINGCSSKLLADTSKRSAKDTGELAGTTEYTAGRIHRRAEPLLTDRRRKV